MHKKEKRWMTRGKFFLIALMCSFAWYTMPWFLFPTLTAVSWVCWVFPKSITMQQIGSGLNGSKIAAFTSTGSRWSLAGSSGDALLRHRQRPRRLRPARLHHAACRHRVLNLYSAKENSLLQQVFDARQLYNIHNIANDKFEIDMDAT
ncbi:hypothetical protein ZWY2020_014242 [Hordeum vulgare]|nr:hypothetical protein ZWY2020_014242 [Hordeum vulgare]